MSKKFALSAAVAATLAASAAAQTYDDPASAIANPQTEGVYAFNSAGYSIAGPTMSCNNLGADVNDVWLSYIPSASGTVIVTLCPGSVIAGGNISPADSALALWDDFGGVPNAQLDCQDGAPNCGVAQSQVTATVTAGVPYYVQLGNWGSSAVVSGSVAIGFPPPPPANDTPAGATLLVGPASVADNNAGSLVDGPFPACGIATGDLWYYWVPTATGIGTVTTCPGVGGGTGSVGTIGNTVIGVWADGGGLPGAAVNCNDDACASNASQVSFAITAGVGVYVSTCGWNGSAGAFTLDFSEFVGSLPTGDDCSVADATAIGPGVYPYNSAGFLVSGPGSGCSAGPDTNDYWFAYTATQTGLAVVSNCAFSSAAPGGSALGTNDTAISAWDATACPPTTELACADGSPDCGFAESEVVFSVTAGVTYFVQVQGWGGGVAISGAIAIAEVLPPVNDDCAGALPIFANQPVSGSTGSATTSTPTGSCAAMGSELWYSFTNPCSGPILIDTCGSTYDTAIAVFDACGGTQLGCNDDSGANGPCQFTLQSYLVITGVPQGNTILIAVGGFVAQTGSFTLTVKCEYSHKWSTPAGPGSIQLENVDGPANALAFSAVTLDLLHPGLPANQTFPNGWFFGVPMGFPELFQQITWPGGLPFTGILDANGYLFNFVLPGGTTSGLAGIATVWSVGVAFDPLTGFATVADTTDPTAFAL